MMQNEFAEYLRKLGRSENTIKTYCHDIEQFFRWCRELIHRKQLNVNNELYTQLSH